MRPIVDGLEAEYAEVQVVRLDAGESATAAALRALRVRGHPTTVVFDSDGEEVGRVLGPAGEAELRTLVEASLSQRPR